MLNPDMFKGVGFFLVSGLILTPVVACYVIWKVIVFLYHHLQWISP